MKTCAHCHTPFTSSSLHEKFCCRGCEYVNALIHAEGFEQFYDLQGNATTRPVKSIPFEPNDFTWLEESQKQAEATALNPNYVMMEFSVDGVSCVGCVWLVENVFLRQAGACEAITHPATGLLELKWHSGKMSLTTFAKELASYGYLLMTKIEAKSNYEMGRLGGRLGLCAAFAMNAMVFTLPHYLGMPHDFSFARIFELVALLSAALSMGVGGSYFIHRGWQSVRTRVPHIDLPIALGLIFAFIGSLVGWALEIQKMIYFDFVATFTFLMLGGRYLQLSAIEKNRKRLHRRRPVPDDFPLTDGDGRISLKDITDGVSFRVQPGQSVPVSAILQQQVAEFSLEWINGEANPQVFRAGRALPAGAILLGVSEISVRATETWKDSLMARLLENSHKPARVLGLEKLLRGYLLAVIAIGILGFFIRWHYFGAVSAVQAMISVFIVSCPCALGVAIPFADEWAGGQMERMGVFIRQSLLWSRLCRVKTIIFDKTGTLTLERPVLQNPEMLNRLDYDATLALALLTQGSLHPVSRSLHEALGLAGQKLLNQAPDTVVHDVPGMGRWISQSDQRWSLGRPGWSTETHSHLEIYDVELCRGSEVMAQFHFKESLRPDAIQALQSLREKGYRIVMLSGDRPEKVNAAAQALGISPEDVHARLLPDDKAKWVHDLDQHDTLYLGDGANDSLALDAAYVTGTPVVDRSLLEAKADFYFLGQGLRFLPELLDLAKKRRRNVRNVFSFALVYNLVAISVSLAGYMSPLVAAIIMPLSSVISLTIVRIGLQPKLLPQLSQRYENQKAEPLLTVSA